MALRISAGILEENMFVDVLVVIVSEYAESLETLWDLARWTA